MTFTPGLSPSVGELPVHPCYGHDRNMSILRYNADLRAQRNGGRAYFTDEEVDFVLRRGAFRTVPER